MKHHIREAAKAASSCDLGSFEEKAKVLGSKHDRSEEKTAV